VVAASRELAELSAWVAEEGRDHGGHVFIASGDTVIAGPGDDPLVKAALPHVAEGSFVVEVDGKAWQYLAQSFPAGQQPWFVGVGVPRAELMQAVDVTRKVTLAINLVLLLVVAAYVIYLERLRAALRDARELGAYHLDERIASGGMGEVWRAHHQLLKRPAAIKMVRRSGVLAERKRTGQVRFAREAQATASLRSPHTVACWDYGVDEEGTLYYVMELLEGTDLQALVTDQGPQPEARVVAMLIQACRSLEEAHGAGLIHRDIKPSNLFLCRLGGEEDFLKVLDFGLVRQAGPQDSRITARDLIVGTVGYMAPEQIEGEVEPRSDVYSLACVAYWLLTGQKVFEGVSDLDVLGRHSREVPIPPSRRLGKPISPDLEALVLRCLSKTPADRPTARALRIALEELRP
jgi:serine/threonine-protein kinase